MWLHSIRPDIVTTLLGATSVRLANLSKACQQAFSRPAVRQAILSKQPVLLVRAPTSLLAVGAESGGWVPLATDNVLQLLFEPKSQVWIGIMCSSISCWHAATLTEIWCKSFHGQARHGALDEAAGILVVAVANHLNDETEHLAAYSATNGEHLWTLRGLYETTGLAFYKSTMFTSSTHAGTHYGVHAWSTELIHVQNAASQYVLDWLGIDDRTFEENAGLCIDDWVLTKPDGFRSMLRRRMCQIQSRVFSALKKKHGHAQRGRLATRMLSEDLLTLSDADFKRVLSDWTEEIMTSISVLKQEQHLIDVSARAPPFSPRSARVVERYMVQISQDAAWMSKLPMMCDMRRRWPEACSKYEDAAHGRMVSFETAVLVKRPVVRENMLQQCASQGLTNHEWWEHKAPGDWSYECGRRKFRLVLEDSLVFLEQLDNGEIRRSPMNKDPRNKTYQTTISNGQTLSFMRCGEELFMRMKLIDEDVSQHTTTYARQVVFDEAVEDATLFAAHGFEWCPSLSCVIWSYNLHDEPWFERRLHCPLNSDFIFIASSSHLHWLLPEAGEVAGKVDLLGGIDCIAYVTRLSIVLVCSSYLEYAGFLTGVNPVSGQVLFNIEDSVCCGCNCTCLVKCYSWQHNNLVVDDDKLIMFHYGHWAITARRLDTGHLMWKKNFSSLSGFTSMGDAIYISEGGVISCIPFDALEKDVHIDVPVKILSLHSALKPSNSHAFSFEIVPFSEVHHRDEAADIDPQEAAEIERVQRSQLIQLLAQDALESYETSPNASSFSRADEEMERPSVQSESLALDSCWKRILLLKFTRSPESLKNALLHAELLREQHEAMRRAGYTCVLPCGAIMIVAPEEICAARASIAGRTLGPCFVIISEQLEAVVLAAVKSGTTHKQNIRMKHKSDLALVSCDGDCLVESRTFLNSSQNLCNTNSVVNSTTVAHRGHNPRQKAAEVHKAH